MTRWIILLGLGALVIGIGSACYGAWTIWQQHQAITAARPVMATVISHETKDLKGGGFVAKVPLVKYEYTVDQKPYRSETVTPAELMLPSTWAESVFQQFPIGAQVQAYYKPDDPGQAFLIPKYSIKPYLPLLVGLVIAAMGLGVIVEQRTSRDTPALESTSMGTLTLAAKQHHLARARMLGLVGLAGLICGAPAILHHLSVSTAPHERMGFLLEGGYAIAVVTLLVMSALGLRQGGGFGTPVVALDRSPAVGQPLKLNLSTPTRFNGMARLSAHLKCEAKDVRIFNIGEEKPDAVLFEEHYLLADMRPVTKEGEIGGTVEIVIPADAPPSTPIDSREPTHVVWTLILFAEGNSGRKAETEYILPVA